MAVGQTRDAGWQIGVSKTLHRPVDQVWAFLVSPEGVAIWLGDTDLPTEPGAGYRTAAGVQGETRSFRENDRVRVTWQPPGRDGDTTLQLAVSPTATGTRLTVHQERLADAAERERQRTHWQGVVARITAALSTSRTGDK